MTISFSRYLAIVLGILTPLAETVRRWSTWLEDPPALFDDYVLGAFLLYGAWRVSKDARSGQRFLAAAWGFHVWHGLSQLLRPITPDKPAYA